MTARTTFGTASNDPFPKRVADDDDTDETSNQKGQNEKNNMLICHLNSIDIIGL